MSVAVITPPVPFVDLALAKAHLRVTTAAEDDLIQGYIDAACASIDGPGGWLGRAISPQTLELRLNGFYGAEWCWGGGTAWDGSWHDWTYWPFASRIHLPFPELIEVVSITYEDSAGADQVLLPGGWQSSEEGVDPAFGTGWPSGRVAADAVRIRYRAGYAPGDGDASTVPSALRSAVLLMVGDLYSNRLGSVIEVGKGSAVENPTLDRLLSPHRVWR